VPTLHPNVSTSAFTKNFESVSKVREHVNICCIPRTAELDVLYPTTVGDADALVVKLTTGRIFLYVNEHNHVVMEYDKEVTSDQVNSFSRHIQDIRHDHV
jgi:hypothetical protein